MSYTKRQIIIGALSELGQTDFVYDAQPEELQGALNALNVLLANWAGEGAETGAFVVSTFDADDLNADSGLPPAAIRGAQCALAMDLAPSYGKQVSQHTMRQAARVEALMRRQSLTIPPRARDLGVMVAGQGSKNWMRVDLPDTDTDVLQGDVDHG